MGRYSTGVYTVDESLEINISYLIKERLLVKGKSKSATLRWSKRGEQISSIGIDTSYTETDKFIRLYYTNTDSKGTKTDYDYKISLTEISSNLGNGCIVYFVCPITNNRCRKLYNAYGYQKWKSRLGYQNRLYYEMQIVSKLDRFNTRYWELDRQINNDNRRATNKYNGKKTKRATKNFILKFKRQRMDDLRWSSAAMSLGLRKNLGL
ncbi:MAG: hypothetical protein EOO44_06250 [Flavobacterium sp.]|nr:MAG: hypothetical protein EOO44_06250 [Flavobacterium sp.]